MANPEDLSAQTDQASIFIGNNHRLIEVHEGVTHAPGDFLQIDAERLRHTLNTLHDEDPTRRAQIFIPRLRQVVVSQAVAESQRFSFFEERVTIEPDAFQVTFDGEPVSLTKTEYDLTLALGKRPGRPQSRASLLGQVWGANYFGNDRVLDVFVKHVRNKIDDDAIRTHRGIGYSAAV